ncbi:MAG TPA: alpha/beta fold hydrolase [Candidatus Acidoferrales bacterium]|nr:alpha/beta fold hydrolase [Candidatus Acidoferrales bacterium]
MTRKIDGYVVFDEVGNQGKQYRLWCGPPITAGNPNIILVHGAVFPLPDEFHDQNDINNYKYCFYDLDQLLYDEHKDNVFTFEYADIPVSPAGIVLGYVNYGDLNKYIKCLVDAIGVVQSKNQNGTINIVAHSFGGLIARYAAKQMPGTINKIITLDTGHCGFELDNFVLKIFESAGVTLPQDTRCCTEVGEGMPFITNLNKGFNCNDPQLVSLAAGNEMPLPPTVPSAPSLRVVDFKSSSMGQVPGNEIPTQGSYNNPPFFVLPNYNHANISQIRDSSHPAYQAIIKFFH